MYGRFELDMTTHLDLGLDGQESPAQPGTATG
jgi:hypothetical protein